MFADVTEGILDLFEIEVSLQPSNAKTPEFISPTVPVPAIVLGVFNQSPPPDLGNEQLLRLLELVVGRGFEPSKVSSTAQVVSAT